MRSSSLLVFTFLCVSVSCLGMRTMMEARYEHDLLPNGFSVISNAPGEKEVSLHFALSQQNLDRFNVLFHDVSNPSSPQYGHYVSWDFLETLLVDTEGRRAVERWLTNEKISFSRAGTGDWLVANLSVSQAELLLDTTFSLIKTNTGSQIIRALAPYSLPETIAKHVDFVGGVHGFVGLVAKSHTRSTNKQTVSEITPEVAKQYTYSTGIVASNSNNTQAVAQFLNQYYAPSDLQLFQQNYDLLQEGVAVTMGTNDENLPGVEATLDIEYIMAMGQDISTWFVSTSGRHEGQEPFLTWIQTMESTPGSPWVHSVSYGDVEASISQDYTIRCDTEFQKFGATGRTILFASGDDGVGCVQGSCKSGNHTLSPNWPATSTAVTSVGGIELESGGTLQGHQISSGGFSNYFPTQTWQSDAVQGYLSTAILPQENYNTAGRAVPDIAAFSNDVRIVYKGKGSGVGGTSCASPMAAGIFALLNDLRLQNNQPTLGFLNPLIYQLAADHSDAFTDVTVGTNTHLCCKGFTAAPGWDPITGLGLPNYSTLAEYILQ